MGKGDPLRKEPGIVLGERWPVSFPIPYLIALGIPALGW